MVSEALLLKGVDSFVVTRTTKLGTGKMAEEVTAPATKPEDPSLILWSPVQKLKCTLKWIKFLD